MSKRFSFVCAILLFLKASLYAQPQDASPPAERTLWDHNGSIMYLIAIGSSRELHYQKPRPGMLQAGAHPDDVLFKGEINDGQISGTAYIFNAQCGQVPFHVKGPVLDNGERIVLTGQTPRMRRNCQTHGEYTSTLQFKLLKTTEVAQPEQTTAQTPNIEESKAEPPSRDAGEPKLPQTAQSTPTAQTPRSELAKPQVSPSAAGESKMPGNPSAQKPPMAQTPTLEQPKLEPHEVSEPNKAITPSPTSSTTVTQSLMDKNILAPLVIALTVALPILFILSLVWVLRSE